MRMLWVLVMGALLASCCQVSSPPAAPPVTAAAEVSPAIEPVQEVQLSLPPETAPAVTEGAVVCRKDGDVRIIGIQELKSGKCVLVYDNRLSGNGTQNALANRPACELQQQRMKENFVRSGFVCE